MVRGISHLLYWLVLVFFVCLIIRMVLDWTQLFKPDFKPKGFLLVIAEGVYSVTDWPLKQLRKIMPPVRVGDAGLDVGFTVLTFFCVALLGFLK